MRERLSPSNSPTRSQPAPEFAPVSPPVEIGLTAAIVAIRVDEPLILTTRADGPAGVAALPSGPFDPIRHRTFEIGLREWVAEQTGAPLGYVEQLYTFGDRGRHARAGDRDPHVVSVGYLALTRIGQDADRRGGLWRSWHDFFPWEDWRKGAPAIIEETIAPGLEYNFFPYRESARRSLAIQYTAGVVYNDYASVTVFDRLSDTLPKQFIKASIGLKQPWGSLNVVSNFSQQLNQLTRYRETIYGNSDIRLFKGFSFNVFAEYERIGDQLSLKKDAASNADVLLRAQQLQTNYSYYLSFGVSYSFGSIFNTIVNPRFTF